MIRFWLTEVVFAIAWGPKLLSDAGNIFPGWSEKANGLHAVHRMLQ